jgi:hypothetical protein
MRSRRTLLRIGKMAPNTAEGCREQAAIARRLADTIHDARTIDGLRQLADEYDKEAADLTEKAAER